MMEVKSLFLHVEGLDLAGKTTTCRLIAERLGDVELRRNALSTGNKVFDIADEIRRNRSLTSDYLGYLFVAALAVDINIFDPPVRRRVQDSSIALRSLAFHRVVGPPAIPEAITQLLELHPRFDYSFVLTANMDVRRKRLQERIRLAPHEVAEDDLMVLKNPEKFQKMEHVLIDESGRRFNSVVIDTSQMSPADVAETILRNLAG